MQKIKQLSFAVLNFFVLANFLILVMSSSSPGQTANPHLGKIEAAESCNTAYRGPNFVNSLKMAHFVFKTGPEQRDVTGYACTSG